MAAGTRKARDPSGLARNRVLDTALRIAEDEGLEQLSMRRLAAELGVAVTTIYWHVGNKQTLLDEMVARVLEEIADTKPRGSTSAERLASIARSVRRQLLARPHLIALVHQQGRTATMFLPAQKALAQELSAVGVTGADAALAVRAILDHVIGFVLLDRARGRSPAQHPSAEELWADANAAVEPETAAHLARPIDAEEAYEFSLNALISALVNRPRRRRSLLSR